VNEIFELHEQKNECLFNQECLKGRRGVYLYSKLTGGLNNQSCPLDRERSGQG